MRPYITTLELAYDTVYFTHYSGAKSMPLHLHFQVLLEVLYGDDIALGYIALQD